VAQLIVIDQILVAERQPEHPLAHEGCHRMLDQLRGAVILKAGGKALHEMDGAIRLAKQQRPGLRGDRPAVKRGHHGAAIHGCKSKQVWATLCRHRGGPLMKSKVLLHNNFDSLGAPMHHPNVRNPG
jgi:hypothetical protein